MTEKCLVTEAREKCQCEMCKISREMRDFSARVVVASEINKILYEVLKVDAK